MAVTDPALPVRRNPLALAALVVGIVAVLLSAALSLGQFAALGSGLQAITVLAVIRTVVAGLLGAAALILGLIGVLLPRRTGRPTAAAGLAIGAVLVFDSLIAILSSLVVRS